MTEYETVVGLEVHCELSTATKLFCGCRNAFGDDPNTNICPVCLGLPGSLPVINRRAVELALRIGAALNCSPRRSIFHRKNYFYPDMPKDYQISQYDEPINVDGWLELPDGSRVGIERAHMEEDTGKTTHVGGGGRIHEADYSLVDYNRAGVPLVEIVSRPDVRSAAQARAYVDELRSILVATGASDGRMEEGSLRVDANVSVRPVGATEYGTRCEVKNLNSLRSLERAVDYEVARQIALVESGKRVAQETRHWDEGDGSTHSLRSKEEANDYRYFPEPDLTPLVPDAELLAASAEGVGPMPAERRHRLSELLAEASGLATRRDSSTDQVVTVVDLGLDELVHGAVDAGAEPRLALARAANEAAASPEAARLLDPRAFAELLKMESSGQLSATQSKEVLAELMRNGGDPVAIAARLGYEEMDSASLDSMLDDVIASNPKEWRRYCEGDDKVAQFLLGQVMKASRGRANGKVVAAAFVSRRGA
ncbi:MAG: Asp-tRNA(Asn)/Glu-tRNA(Gln) amidotransferase subunit GatB [Acidimicrobiales bacterium]|jgi:aspartyl-tRNA(Asn)/glutamyl-tRNA(Gln) amidotransferase subunit B